ncbi:MAG: hypothetical protein ACI3XQ_05850 [Eubacteriales bacterium]
MDAWEKNVKCIKCGKEMQIKSFRKFPGKHIIGKGYICDECLKAEKEAQAEVQAEAQAEAQAEVQAETEAQEQSRTADTEAK